MPTWPVAARRACWTVHTLPVFAWVLHAAVPRSRRAPLLFEAALHGNAIHSLQHVSFLGSALLSWWAVIGDGAFRHGRRLSMLYTFTTMAHTVALAALLTWSDIVWYPSYIGAGESLAPALWKTSSRAGRSCGLPGWRWWENLWEQKPVGKVRR